jgi:hypothetical protein
MRIVVIGFAIAATINSLGCESVGGAQSQSMESLLDEYHVTVDNNQSGNFFVQFANGQRMASSILDCGAIESCLGGFPDYINVTIGRDRKTVVERDASSE